MATRKSLPPIRRWSQGATEAAGVALGQQSPEIPIDIPRSGYICALGIAVFDPTLNAAETTNLWADLATGIQMLINDESPTNFKFIRTRNFAGTGRTLRRVLMKVRVRDRVRIIFANDRTAGNALQFKLDVGMCDTRDVEIDEKGNPVDDENEDEDADE